MFANRAKWLKSNKGEMNDGPGKVGQQAKMGD
jgi:hypothetical protein